jgi:diguanylate cyclase (GGDEF)-like protein
MELPGVDRPSIGSPSAEQLEEGFARLKFTGLFEKEFREFYVAQNRSRGQLSGVIALVLVFSITLIDFFLGSGGSRVNILRLSVLCPSLILIVLASYLPGLRQYYHQIAAAGVTVVGLVATYLCQLAALSGASYLLAGVVLVVLYASLFLGLLFDSAVSIAGFLVVAFVGMGYALGLPANQLAYSTAILGTAAVIGGISAYNLEHALRTNFLETRLLNELAERDGLTGLYNRRMFDDFIRRIWRQSRREQATLQIVMVDIDYFKIYNDIYGHQAGDDCLKKVAQSIARSAKRPFDFSARYGGEEFVLVMYGPPSDYGKTLPEQIRLDVMGLAIAHEGSVVNNMVTVSIGVAFARAGGGRSLAGAIQTADEALYQAKQQGRNQVVFKDADESEIETGNFRAVGYRETG